MALTAIFEGVKAQFDALLPGVEQKLGGEHHAAHGAPPRIVWMPTEDAYTAPEIHGDTGYVLGEGARPLYLCEPTIAVHLWGKDFDQAEQLRDTFVTAMRNSAAAAMRVSRGIWLHQDQAVVSLGRVYVLVISFPVPVLEVIPGGSGLASVSSTDTTDTAFDPQPAAP